MGIKKKYKDFINESYYKRKVRIQQNLSKSKLDNILDFEPRMSNSKLSELRDEFTDDVFILSEFYKKSFSDMCKIEDTTQSDLDIDYYQMQKLLDKKGWDFESIKNLFNKEVDEICGDDIFGVVHKSPLDSTNGYIDYYLYRTVERLGLDKSKIHLGGNGWVDSLYYDEELPIRYKYGYHQTEYGKLMLKEANTTVEEFVSKVTTFLVSMLKEDWGDEVIRNVLRKKYKDRYTEISKRLPGFNIDVNKFEKYHILEEDRIIFLISNVVDDINELLADINDGNEITNEEFATELADLLYSFSKDIESTGTELILYGNFEKNLDWN